VLQKTAKDVREDLCASSVTGPEHVFKQAMKALKEADANRFLLENVLESLKTGSPTPTLFEGNPCTHNPGEYLGKFHNVYYAGGYKWAQKPS
jgi:hypothetical protein